MPVKLLHRHRQLQHMGVVGCEQVNGKLQSSDPDVYVVGDLANYPLPRYDGQRFRQEHVQNARESAAHAVSAILKPEETGDYNYLPVSLRSHTAPGCIPLCDVSSTRPGSPSCCP